MIMSEMQEGIQMAMMTGQAMAFVVDKGVTLTRQILEALAKLIKMSALYTAPKIKNAWKRQPGAVSMDQIQRRIPIRINEADQQKFFDWMHRAEIPYCPLQDLNKNDVYAEFVIDERDILRLQSIVDRNQREFSMEDFKIINWEDYAMNHITEEDLDALAKEMNIDLEKEANQKLPSQAKENDMEELKNKVFLDDFAKGNAVAITCNKKLLNKKLSDETQLTFRIPGELDKFVSIPMKDLILTDGEKTYLGRLDLKKEYTVYDSMNRSLYHRNGMQLKRNFDDVTRSEFTQKKPSKMNTKQR